MNAALLDAETQPVPTVKLPRVTLKLPAMRTREQQFIPAPFISILDGRFDWVQKALHPRLQCACAANGGVLYGSLFHLQERCKMPFMSGDLWALAEGGLIELHVSGDWCMVSCKGGGL